MTRVPGYKINAPYGFEADRVLGLFHFLAVHLTRPHGWSVFRCMEVHEYRPNLGVTPCIALQVPCFHPLFHGFTITMKIGSRRSSDAPS